MVKAISGTGTGNVSGTTEHHEVDLAYWNYQAVDAYWLEHARAHAARCIARFVAASAARFGRWAINAIWARDVISAIPPEGGLCAQGDEVLQARRLLLGENAAGISPAS